MSDLNKNESVSLDDDVSMFDDLNIFESEEDIFDPKNAVVKPAKKEKEIKKTNPLVLISDTSSERDRIQKEINERENSIISQVANKANPNGLSIDRAVYELIKLKSPLILDSDENIYMYNKNEKVYYHINTADDLKPLVSDILSSSKYLRSFDSSDNHSRIAKSVEIFLKNEEEESSLNRKITTVNCLDKNGKAFVMNLKKIFHKEHGFCFEAEIAKATNRSFFKIFACLNFNNFVESKTEETFLVGVKYHYIPKVNYENPLFKYFLSNMFESKEFEIMEKMYYGAICFGEEIQTSLLRMGTGRNGKGLRTRLDTRLFNKKNIIQMAVIDFTNKDSFAWVVINLKRWIQANELKKEGFNEQYFKNLNGQDALQVREMYKSQGSRGIKTDKAGIVINANYNDLFILHDTDKSMKERITPVSTAEAIDIIPNLYDVITDGGTITSPAFIKKYNNGEIISVQDYNGYDDYLEWILEGALEYDKFGKRLISDSFGKEVIDFKKEILSKMTGSNDFFVENIPVFTDIRDGEGVFEEDLYNYFLKMTNRRKEQYSKTKFTKELKKEILERYPETFNAVQLEAYFAIDKRSYVNVSEVGGRPDYKYRKLLGVTFENSAVEIRQSCGKTVNFDRFTGIHPLI